MINIFFIAFEFPPLGGAGVQRSLKFVKYLQDFGIKPIVITIREQDYLNVFPGKAMDYTLLKDLPNDVIIERIKCFDPKSGKRTKFQEWLKIYFGLTENLGRLWKKNLLDALDDLTIKYQPQAIYVSIPPFAMGPLSVLISKKLNLPLLIDFRDGWSQWCLSPYGSIIHYKLLLRIERNCLRNASGIVCTSKQIMEDLIRVHSHSIKNLKSKISVIHNGFDVPISSIKSEIRLNVPEKLIIGYVGHFYYTPQSRELMFKKWWQKKIHQTIQYVPRREDWLYRSPYFFFKSISELSKIMPDLKDRAEIRFAGQSPEWLIKQIEEFQLENMVKHVGYLDHDSVIKFQQDCDVLLITSSKVIGGKDYSIAGKTFEYFTLSKPIIGFVCESEQKDLLKKSGMAIIFDPDDSKGSALRLKKLLDEGIDLYPNIDFLQKYQRKYLTSLLNLKIKSISEK